MLDGKVNRGRVGFGVPVIKYKDKTYFSSSAQVSIQKTDSACLIKKTYTLDTISRKRWKTFYLNDKSYSLTRKIFESFYLKNKRLSPLFNKLMELRDIAKIKTEFEKVEPRGTVAVSYQCKPSTIFVNVDFSGLKLEGCREVLVLNEQGSTVFRNYFDSDGLILRDSKIGAGRSCGNAASLLDIKEIALASVILNRLHSFEAGKD